MLAGLGAAGLAGCSENAQTGRKQLVVVDEGQLMQLSDQTWSEITRQVPPVRDPAPHRRLARIGGRIAQAAGLGGMPWQFVVLDSPDLNAFVLPNGKVGFFRGLFSLARSDDEVASVLGHEVGHLVARHPAERVSQQLALQAGVGLVEMVLSQGENPDAAPAIAGALGLGAAYGVLLPYSRKHELEADRVGVELMRRASFDPQAAVTFWTRMTERQAATSKPIEALSTHPADDRRLAELKAAVAAAA
ncbi:M48 family metallopeptidase [Phenylobacterium sp.]|uniref:M48 family metallopeptidase n=1 Tax=Phenylobacterium sp. TaxID=1871053 RepID=UPI002F92F304